MPIPEEILRRLGQAHAEALRVGDSPQRADQLAEKVAELLREVARSDAPEETRARVRGHLESAERVLRRDDDGREAARHLQQALRSAGERPTPPEWPF
ncbi:MAG TPA: hypothetical protein VHG28_24575 [Longimicrobiaceae bacterium]|nr:hypothetical protein [Longimicrobiaceae bacterium]